MSLMYVVDSVTSFWVFLIIKKNQCSLKPDDSYLDEFIVPLIFFFVKVLKKFHAKS